VIFERIGRIFAPKKPEPCIGNDPSCPCRDGDACHYRDVPGPKGWPGSKAMPIPSKPEEKQEVRGLAMVGYSRRGFLGVLGAAAAATYLPSSRVAIVSKYAWAEARPPNLIEAAIVGDDFYRIIWPVTRRESREGVIYVEELMQSYQPWAGALRK
jgi:hypothetical protein